MLTTSSYQDTVQHEDSVLQSDMAFLDINLSANQPSGVEVYQWLRSHGYAKPIYFLTGHGKTSPEVLRAGALGTTAVLSKPLPLQKLKSLIGPRR